VLATVNGCRIFFERMGLKGLTTILTLHSPGGSVDSRYVKTIFRPFCDDYQVVVFDLRGCGRSEDVGSPSFAQLSADAEMLRKKLRLGQVIVAGISCPRVHSEIPGECQRPHPVVDGSGAY